MSSKPQENRNVSYRGSMGNVDISEATYNKVAGLGNQVASADISSLDRQELTAKLNSALDTNTNSSGDWDSAENVVDPVANELSDAIAGSKPKYRYRKYLDATQQLQSDQPG